MRRQHDTLRIQNLRQTLHDQGRSIAWLSRRIGQTYRYTHDIVNGRREAPPAVVEAIYHAIGKQAYSADSYRGRTVLVPTSVYRREVPDDVVLDEYAAAWMRDWVKEHGDKALAEAARRAYDRAVQYGIADTGVTHS